MKSLLSARFCTTQFCATRFYTSAAALLAFVLLFTNACGARPTPTPPAATATLIPTIAAPGTELSSTIATISTTVTTSPTVSAPTVSAATPVALSSVVDRELLGAADIDEGCDAPPEATFTCDNVSANGSSTPNLTVQTNASTYGRWSAHWQNAAPLSGDETLTLRFTSSGKLSPNIYLDSSDGSRMGIPLSEFGLAEGEQTIHLPLREVRDQEGKTPDFSTVNGIELVFEWADMQGTLALESLQINSVWREAVTVGEQSVALAAALKAPEGFVVHAIAENLEQVTRIDFTDKGEMLAGQQNGRVWLYRDTDGDGAFDERILYTVATGDLVGLLYDPADGGVWLGSHGTLMHTLDSDGNGVADQRQIRFEGLPWGRHQNNGLAWNPDPDPFSGEAGGTWLYFGFGSVEDLEVGGQYNAKILRFPRTGKSADDLEVVSTGNRNAYGVVWANLPVDPAQPEGEQAWQLFASENGPDFNDAPDEVNHIRWGHNYGFPDQFGPVAAGQGEGDPYSGPVYAVAAHASADGIAYMDNPKWPAEYRTLYVSLFGEVFSPTPVGHYIERISLHSEKIPNSNAPNGEITYRGDPSPFITGFDRPLPLMAMKNGDMLIGDYATGVIYEIAYDEIAYDGS